MMDAAGRHDDEDPGRDPGIQSARRLRRALHRLAVLLATADVARAYTLAALGTVFASFLITRVSSQVTYVTIVAGLCLVGLGILVARRRELSLVRLVPTTLVLLLAWVLASVIWTTDRSYTLVGWASLTGLAFVAIVIAHVRDTLQTARALGDVMRVLLSVSLGLEILSGVLFDVPFRFLGIQGAIATGGPIQGIFGTRNLLGFATVLALITFVIEWRTASVRPGVAAYSVVLGGILAVLSDSPTVLVLAAAVGLATAALTIVRHTEPHRRNAVQLTLGVVVVVGLLIAYAARDPIIRWMGAGTDFYTRSDLWNLLLDFVRDRPILGWGWFGPWATDELPFALVNILARDHHLSALNAYFDLLLQVGWVGLVLLLAMAGIGLVRSWLVAGQRRSVVYAWTPLILVALLVNSMFESFTLFGFGWLMLVLCVVRAGLSRSWRGRLDAGSAAPALPHER